MKLNVWKMKDGSLMFWDKESRVIEYGGNESKGRTARHLGTIEVDEPGKEIKPDPSVKPPKFEVFSEGYDGGRAPGDKPKKTVTKELEDRGPTGEGDKTGYIEKFFIPANAKNIKCTYEMEDAK